MTENYNDAVNENEALVEAMLGKSDDRIHTAHILAHRR